MPPKRLNGQERGYIGDSPTKKRAPPKPYTPSPWLTEYTRERDIVLSVKYPHDEEVQERVKQYTNEQVQEVLDKYFKNKQIGLL